MLLKIMTTSDERIKKLVSYHLSQEIQWEKLTHELGLGKAEWHFTEYDYQRLYSTTEVLFRYCYYYGARPNTWIGEFSWGIAGMLHDRFNPVVGSP